MNVLNVEQGRLPSAPEVGDDASGDALLAAKGLLSPPRWDGNGLPALGREDRGRGGRGMMLVSR